MTTLSLNDDILKSDNINKNLKEDVDSSILVSLDKKNINPYINYRLDTDQNLINFDNLKNTLVNIKNDSINEILILDDFLKFTRVEILPVCMHLYNLLKSGGRLCVECPDFSYIINSIKQMDQNSLLPGEKTLISYIFGDSTSKNSKHTNKWGYSIHTLGMLLNQSGFQDIEQEFPLHSEDTEKFIRIVGYKR